MSEVKCPTKLEHSLRLLKPLRLMTAQSGISTTQVDDAGGVAGGSDGASYIPCRHRRSQK